MNEMRPGRVRRFLRALADFAKGPSPYQCPDCGHWWGLSGPEGPPHDKAACEVAKLRREVAALRADLSGRGAES